MAIWATLKVKDVILYTAFFMENVHIWGDPLELEFPESRVAEWHTDIVITVSHMPNKHGNINQKQIRSRYLSMSREPIELLPTKLCMHLVGDTDGPPFETALISLSLPSCNKIERTFDKFIIIPCENKIRQMHIHGKSRQRWSAKFRHIQHLTSGYVHHHLAAECDLFLRQILGALIHYHKAVQRAEDLRKIQQTQQLTLRRAYSKFGFQTLNNSHGPVGRHKNKHVLYRFAAVKPHHVDWQRVT